MWKIATFSLLAKIFSGNISRGSLTKQKRFSVLPKKIHGCGQALISCMNYKLAKKFFVFYENFQIWRSRWVQVEKFEIFWKNQKTMFLVKKIFFSSIRYSRGIRRSPWWRNNNFTPTHWQGNDKNADPHQSGLKIQFLLYKRFWPHIQVRKPRGCVNTHFLAIFHHLSPKNIHRPKICILNLMNIWCIVS